MAESVQQGDVYACPVEGCDCEITVTSGPSMEPSQAFVDCCGHQMEKRGRAGGGEAFTGGGD
jgi:hypothetical protein